MHMTYLLAIVQCTGPTGLVLLVPEQPPKTRKTGNFGVLHNKSSYTNIYTHVGSAPPSCFGTKNDHLTTPAPLSFFSLDTCSIDTDHYANFRILRKKEKRICWLCFLLI